MDSSNSISKKVNGLIEKNNDAYKGFKKASENAESVHLRDFFMDEATQRKEFATELSKELKSYDPEFKVDTDGSATGTIHRAWMDIKAALSMDDDEAILEECIRGEEASLEEYQEFQNDYSTVHSGINNSIKNQQLHVQKTLDRVKGLEDLH